MIPVLPPPALGQEIAACAVLGGCTGAVRAFFPVKSRAAILPDVLWVGAVLTAVQSYAAGGELCRCTALVHGSRRLCGRRRCRLCAGGAAAGRGPGGAARRALAGAFCPGAAAAARP